MLCTLCCRSEISRETFRDIVHSLRYDYILEEYGSLYDAWRVYQGVALYREYRGIGGVTRTLDEVPRPCHMCLVKIVSMAQSIYQVTSALEQSRPRSSVHRQPVANGRRSQSRAHSDTGSDDMAEEEEEDTKDVRRCELELHSDVKRSDSVASQNETLQPSNSDSQSENCVEPSKIPSSKMIHSEGELDEKEKSENIKEEQCMEKEQKKDVSNLYSSRPKRSAGRSLFERNPDFALGREFAKILRQKTMKETRLIKLGKKIRDESAKVADFATANPQSPEKNMIEDAGESAPSGWKSSEFRSEQLSRLDEALSSAGWSAAIRSGKNMENNVFKEAKSETEYVSGIQRLVDHFNKGSLSNSNSPERKSNCVPHSPPKVRRTVKPTRKILDGMDFRRKVVVSKVSCSECGDKFTKSKLKIHMESVHENKIEEEAEENSETRTSSPPPAEAVDTDNISIAESELSISSNGTGGSSRPKRSTPTPIKAKSSSRSSTPLPVPSNNTDASQTVMDEFVVSGSDSDHSARSSMTDNCHNNSSAYLLNNFTSVDKAGVRKCSLEDNELDDGIKSNADQGRPQRRKRSMEERHPDFVIDRQVKSSKIVTNSSPSSSPGRKSRNEI